MVNNERDIVMVMEAVIAVMVTNWWEWWNGWKEKEYEEKLVMTIMTLMKAKAKKIERNLTNILSEKIHRRVVCSNCPCSSSSSHRSVGRCSSYNYNCSSVNNSMTDSSEIIPRYSS